jgi:hypothetical protein
MQKANKCMKKHLASLIIKEMQIKTTLRSDLTPVRLAIIKKINNKCWQGCRIKEPSCTAGGNVNYGTSMEISMEGSQETKDRPTL